MIGGNTEYAEDPEEIMADNFGLMFVDMYDSRLIEWVTEEIPNGIVAYMKNGG